MRISRLCELCATQTEWIDLQSLRFFCSPKCGDNTSPVIQTTRNIRKKPRNKCSISGDQKCHLFGLNAAKVIFNHYALEECLRIDDETLKGLIIAINENGNIYCCSDKENDHDKETEKAFLDVFVYKKLPYAMLDNEGIRMYKAMLSVFDEIQRILGNHPSLEIERIRTDFETIINRL